MSMISVASPRIDRRAERAGALAADLDVERLLDDVDDLVDGKPHRPVAVGKHQQRLRAVALDRAVAADMHQRHQLAAVLHHVAAVRQLDLARSRSLRGA